MAIYICCDHAGFELKNLLVNAFKTQNESNATKQSQEIIDLSTTFQAGDDYPLVAVDLAQKMTEPDLAIALCGTGEGICMALNRFSHIRAATVSTLKIATIVRQHNHANVICLPARTLTLKKALLLINKFLQTNPDVDSRHCRRVAQLSTLRL